MISAKLALKQLQWDVAETFLLQAREKFPDIVQTWMKSAECSEHQGFTEKANEYNKKGSFENQVGKQFAFIFISVSIESNNS